MILVLLWAKFARAENQNRYCLPIKTALQTMKKTHNEVPVLRATNQRNELIIITVNKKTQHWTALQSVKNVWLCSVSYGDSLELIKAYVKIQTRQ